MFTTIEKRVDERNRQLELLAWSTANIMNSNGIKPRVSTEKLLKRPPKEMNNDAVAAMLAGSARDPLAHRLGRRAPKGAKDAKGAPTTAPKGRRAKRDPKTEAEAVAAKKEAFRAMMRARDADAKRQG